MVYNDPSKKHKEIMYNNVKCIGVVKKVSHNYNKYMTQFLSITMYKKPFFITILTRKLSMYNPN